MSCFVVQAYYGFQWGHFSLHWVYTLLLPELWITGTENVIWQMIKLWCCISQFAIDRLSLSDLCFLNKDNKSVMLLSRLTPHFKVDQTQSNTIEPPVCWIHQVFILFFLVFLMAFVPVVSQLQKFKVAFFFFNLKLYLV